MMHWTRSNGVGCRGEDEFHRRFITTWRLRSWVRGMVRVHTAVTVFTPKINIKHWQHNEMMQHGGAWRRYSARNVLNCSPRPRPTLNRRRSARSRVTRRSSIILRSVVTVSGVSQYMIARVLVYMYKKTPFFWRPSPRTSTSSTRLTLESS